MNSMGITHTTPAGGNIFADLGFPREEAENLKLRSSLMIAIEKIIAARGLKQTEAAELFGVSQPRISDLTRGKFDVFTIDSLVNMLAHAGFHVKLSVEAAA
jgi:predicted XRE-type DNA-binding protein